MANGCSPLPWRRRPRGRLLAALLIAVLAAGALSVAQGALGLALGAGAVLGLLLGAALSRPTEARSPGVAAAAPVPPAEEPAARSDAERAHRQAALLAEAGGHFVASLDYETTIESLVRLAVPELGDWCTADLLEADGRIRRVAVVHADPERERLARRLIHYPPDPSSGHPVARVLRSGEPFVCQAVTDGDLRDRAQCAEHLSILEQLGMASVIVAPLKARARTIGALFLVSSRPDRRYGPSDVAAVQALADRAALAMDNARLYGEARAAEAEARRVRRVFESFMDRTPAVAYMKDEEGRLVYANQALARLTGKPIAELLGRTDAEVFPEAARRFREHDLEAMAAGEPREFHETTCDADGSERHWISLKFPFSDPSGRRLLAGLSVELTAQRRAEAALERLRRQHELILNSAGEGIFGVDLEGRFTFVNPAAARMLGWAPEDLIGRPQHELIHHTRPDGGPYPRADCPMYRAVRDGVVCRGDDERFWRRDGTAFPIAYTATPLLEDGRVAGKVVTFQDTSEQKQLEAQVRQAQKLEAVGRLAGGIAHDFNNLMTAVTGFAELALARIPDGDRLRSDIEEIRRAGVRAASLTRQLLAFSRRQVLEPRVLDLNAVVTGMEQMLHRVIGEDIRLATSTDPALRPVKADPGQLEQVLMNLALNARDAMPAGGTLTIETANAEIHEADPRRHDVMRPGRYARLTVSDTGCGMDAETRASAFEPFFTTKEPGRGTGLGLATVYGIVKQSGGYVWVDSEPGRGAAFTIYLPSADEPRRQVAPPPEGAVPAAPAPRPAGGRETILLVEDDEAVRGIARRILERAGYTVLGAADGDEAAAVAARHQAPIALLLADLVMPGGTGPEVAARVAAARPGIRVLFTSGYAESAVLDRARVDARDAFIAKPFTSEALLGKVRDVLDASPPCGRHPAPLP